MSSDGGRTAPGPRTSRAAIGELYDEYAYLLDEGDYDGWLELFSADADYMVLARENWLRGLPLATLRCDTREMLADRLEAIRSTQFFATRTMRHFVSAVRPASGDGSDGSDGSDNADVATVTANFLVTEVIADEPARVHSVGQYRDVVVLAGGRLRFLHKVAVYDAPLVLNSLVIPL